MSFSAPAPQAPPLPVPPTAPPPPPAFGTNPVSGTKPKQQKQTPTFLGTGDIPQNNPGGKTLMGQ